MKCNLHIAEGKLRGNLMISVKRQLSVIHETNEET